MRKALSFVVAGALIWSAASPSWAGPEIGASAQGDESSPISAPAPSFRQQTALPVALTPLALSLSPAWPASIGMPAGAQSVSLVPQTRAVALVDLPSLSGGPAGSFRSIQQPSSLVVTADANASFSRAVPGKPVSPAVDRLLRLNGALKGSGMTLSPAQAAAAIDAAYNMSSPRAAETADMALTPGGLLVRRELIGPGLAKAAAPSSDHPMIDDGYHRIPNPAAARGGMVPGLLAVGALTALGAWLMHATHLPHSTFTEVGGWVGAFIMMSFPALHLLEIRREAAELAKGGEHARVARQRLAGSSADSHIVLMGGKLLQWFGIFASGAPALIFNVLGRVVLSWTVMLNMRNAGALSNWKFAAVTGAIVGLLAATPWIASMTGAVLGLGIVGAAVYATFTLPQYVLNHLSFLHLRSVDPEEAFNHFSRLRSNSLLKYGLMLSGDLMLLTEYWSHGLIYNAVACLFAALTLVLILEQMHRAKVMPWHKSSVRSAAAE